MAKARDFDVAEYLNSPEAIAAYLSEAFETGDDSLIAQALGAVARVKGMKAVAEETGLNRENLYRSLSEGGRPELGTVMKVLDALDVQLVAKPKDETERPLSLFATSWRMCKRRSASPSPACVPSRRRSGYSRAGGRGRRAQSASRVRAYAASSRASSLVNSKHNCAPSSLGSQLVICGKMVR